MKDSLTDEDKDKNIKRKIKTSKVIAINEKIAVIERQLLIRDKTKLK